MLNHTTTITTTSGRLHALAEVLHRGVMADRKAAGALHELLDDALLEAPMGDEAVDVTLDADAYRQLSELVDDVRRRAQGHLDALGTAETLEDHQWEVNVGAPQWKQARKACVNLLEDLDLAAQPPAWVVAATTRIERGNEISERQAIAAGSLEQALSGALHARLSEQAREQALHAIALSGPIQQPMAFSDVHDTREGCWVLTVEALPITDTDHQQLAVSRTVGDHTATELLVDDIRARHAAATERGMLPCRWLDNMLVH